MARAATTNIEVTGLGKQQMAESTRKRNASA